MKNFLKNKIFRVCLILLILTYPFTSEFRFFYSTGNSMLPTYENGELLVIYKSTSMEKNWKPDRGQVVVVKEEEGDTLVKRVVGLEGEHLEIRHGRIYINNKKYEDHWTHQDITFWTETVEVRATKPKEDWLFLNTRLDVGVIPKGYIWVIGDNRKESWMGKVKIKDIKGWVLF